MEESIKNFKIETAYNTLHLVEHRGKLELRGRGKAIQSIVDLETPYHLELENLRYLVSVLLFIPSPRRILMLGTGAGSLLHFLRHHYPSAHLSALDIDSELIEELRARAILPPPDEYLEYLYADAATYLEQTQQRFDLVAVDLFYGAQTPNWLLQKKCLRQLHHLLSDSGALAFNLLLDSNHDLQRFYRELQALFQQQTLSLPVPELENRIVYAVNGNIESRDMAEQPAARNRVIGATRHRPDANSVDNVQQQSGR